ncbi:MAG: TetR/AcrR family transcriptional regulator [Desulfobacterales bacterium]|nr:TetR/AcrR family transcriptional regulator [Desulfobacterales bacterium]
MKKNTFADLKEKERKAKREVIIDAAERVFGVKPFNKVNIRDIAAEAGISHATIYRYFPDQQTLFVEAFLRGVDEILARVDAVVKTQDGFHVLEAVAESFIGFLSGNDHYFRMMTHFMLDGNLAPALLERLNAAERSLLDKIEAIFVADGATENTRALAHAFFAALNGILISFRDYPGRDREAVLSHMQSLGRLIAKRFGQN